MLTLDNGTLRIEFDDFARITRLENRKTGGFNAIARPVSVFRAVLKTGQNWENVALAEDARLSLTGGGDYGEILAEALQTPMGEIPVSVRITARLDGDQCAFGARVENHSDSTLVDFIFPCVGGISTLGHGDVDLLIPQFLGERHRKIAKELKNLESWDGQNELVVPYPYTASMQWMLLEDGEDCLYLSGRDDQIYASTLRAVGGETGDVTLEMDKMAFVKPGEAWDCPGYLMWLYRGAWQKAAEEYRAWADTWRTPVEPKEWIKNVNGYYLVINKQQYGDEVWPYRDIPSLYEQARAHGCDTLGLFGWYDSGHDNQYPDLEVSPTMGGEAALKAGIQKVQAEGGHVTLYYQGHLIDVGTKFYQNGGREMEGKSRWGTPYYEQYSKFSRSDFLRVFSRKLFSTVCPWSEPWHKLMAERANWIRSFGADGVLYDQIGGINPSPCFDESHGHKNPGLSYSQGRKRLMGAIRQSVDAHEGYAFLTETVTDAYSQYIDLLHGIGSLPGAKDERMGAGGAVFMPEMFRHAFPDTLCTVRNPRPYLSPRMVNYAMAYGFRFEMELRYRKDREFIEANEHPEWREYARKAGELRVRNRETLLKGQYSCNPALETANPGLIAGLFTAKDGARALLVWNDGDEPRPLSLPGFSASRWETSEGSGEGAPESVAANSIIALFEARGRA